MNRDGRQDRLRSSSRANLPGNCCRYRSLGYPAARCSGSLSGKRRPLPESSGWDISVQYERFPTRCDGAYRRESSRTGFRTSLSGRIWLPIHGQQVHRRRNILMWPHRLHRRCRFCYPRLKICSGRLGDPVRRKGYESRNRPICRFPDGALILARIRCV